MVPQTRLAERPSLARLVASLDGAATLLSRWAVRIGLPTVALFLVTFQFGGSPIEDGLDGSWIFALNYFFHHGIIVGRDEIFTYGPLGFAACPQPIGSNLGIALGFDVVMHLLTAALLSAIYIVGRPASRSDRVVGFTASLLLLGFAAAAPFSRVQCAFGLLRYLFIASAVLALAAEKRDSPTLFVIAGVFAGLALLAKPFYGAASLGIFSAGSCLRLVRRERWWLPLLGLASAFCACLVVYVGMYGTPAGLGKYFRGVAEVSRGYFATMPSLGAVETPWLLGTPASFAVAIWLARRERGAVTALVSFGPAIYLSVRYGVAKQPREAFVMWMVVLMLVVLDLRRATVWGRAALPMLAGLYFFNLNANYGTEDFGRFDAISTVWKSAAFQGTTQFRDKILRFKSYRSSIEEESRATLSREGALAPQLRNLLSRYSVDTYPHELVWIEANGLSWRPRPVPASYCALTPWLDEQDARFFASSGAPDAYLWQHGRGDTAMLSGVDGRYVLNDEPQAILEMFRHYRVTQLAPQLDAPFIVLTRSPTPLLGETHSVGSTRARMFEWVTPPAAPAGSILRGRLNIRRNAIGELLRSLWYEPKTMIQYVVVKEGADHVEEHRLGVDNARSGLWLSPFLLDITTKSAPMSVRAFRINPSAPARFEESYEIEWDATPVGPVPAPDWRAALIRQ